MSARGLNFYKKENGGKSEEEGHFHRNTLSTLSSKFGDRFDDE